jgi:hypothetical protein
MKEFGILNQFCAKEALKNFPIVITHMKPVGERESVIKKQLAELNALHLKLIFPEQGQKMEF